MIIHYDIPELEPYINWVYFFFAWQLKGEEEQKRMHAEAEEFLHQQVGHYRAHAVFLIEDAHSKGDNIILERTGKVIPLLRQQQGRPCLCLSDFLNPEHDRLGLFATSVDAGLETDFNHDPYYKMLAQLLADRLAEAAAERMHEEVRKNYWGYAHDEHLSISDLHVERFQGIRPAVGYPSLPDGSVNFLLDEVLDMKQIGIRLTENGAMRPHASVTGLMISHPQARYFSVGKIGDDQLADYARRRNIPLELARKFLASNLSS